MTQAASLAAVGPFPPGPISVGDFKQNERHTPIQVERESEINSTSWLRLPMAFYVHQAGDLKLVFVFVFVCGAHRNGVASYHDVTRPGGGAL